LFDKLYSEAVCEHEDLTVLWNQDVHTNREVMANRPDITIKNRKEKMCILIDMAVIVDKMSNKRKQKRN
jgi:hypothetical protein